MAERIFRHWVFFDARLPQPRGLTQALLASDVPQSQGERSYLTTMAATALRPYGVKSVKPGSAVTFVEEFEDHETEVDVLAPGVSTKLASLDLVVARVVPRGVSGQPELEGDVLYLERCDEMVAEVCEDMESSWDTRAELVASGLYGPLWCRLWERSAPWWWGQKRPL